MNKYISYRPEIDGLRAIAVLSVIFYHSPLDFLNTKLFSGGFIGVDIFFVISGYLITKIIITEYEKTKKFSFLNFYKRRIKRIIPALLFVIIVTFPFVFFLVLPNFFIDYLESIISVVLFFSNIYFWDTNMAYDMLQNMEFQPFLHAWTLSVEEQFYFLFPIIFIFLLLKFKKYLFFIVTLGFFLSLFLADYMSYNHAAVNFYFLPTRAWEFLAGSIIVLIEKKDIEFFKKKHTKNFFILLGILLIIFSISNLDDKMYLPSVVTVIPILGTSFVIFFSHNNNFFIKVLASNFFSNLGKISYSLYLWHYPIFIIYPNLNFVAQIFLIFFLSIITYFLIEKKFREKNSLNFYSIKTIIFFIFLILIVDLLLLSKKNNFNYTNYPEILTNAFKEKKLIDLNLILDQEVLTSKKNIFIAGDSHMGVLYNALKQDKKIKRFNLIDKNLSQGCYYVHGFDKIKYFTKKKLDICTKENQKKRTESFLSKRESIVIIGGRLPQYLNTPGPNFSRFFGKKDQKMNLQIYVNSENLSFEEGIKNSINYLLSKNVKVILVYPVPVLDFNPVKKIFDRYIHDKENFKSNQKKDPFVIGYDSFLNYAEKSHKLLDEISHPNLYKIYTHEIFCDSKKNYCKTHDNEAIFYRDNNHLSKVGNKKIIKQIFKKINLIEKNLPDNKLVY